MLYLAQPEERRNVPLLALTIIVLVWVSWAASAMARLLKIAGERLRMLNAELREATRRPSTWRHVEPGLSGEQLARSGAPSASPDSPKGTTLVSWSTDSCGYLSSRLRSG